MSLASALGADRAVRPSSLPNGTGTRRRIGEEPDDFQALQAFLATGDWLVLAEGYVPKELAPLALPM